LPGIFSRTDGTRNSAPSRFSVADGNCTFGAHSITQSLRPFERGCTRAAIIVRRAIDDDQSAIERVDNRQSLFEDRRERRPAGDDRNVFAPSV
jgi:hypothetical protein